MGNRTVDGSEIPRPFPPFGYMKPVVNDGINMDKLSNGAGFLPTLWPGGGKGWSFVLER